MNLPTALAIAAIMVRPGAGGHGSGGVPVRHRHGGPPGGFPGFSSPDYRRPDLKFTLDDVDVASFGRDATIWCRLSVGCTLDISLTEAGSKKPFDSFHTNIPATGLDPDGPDSDYRWIAWKLIGPGVSEARLRRVSVKLRLGRPSGDPAGTFFVITRGVTPASVDPTYGRSRIDPHFARPPTDHAASVSFWLDKPARVDVRVTREHDPGGTPYDHKVYPYLAAGLHQHRWEFLAGGAPKLVPDMYVARIQCTDADAGVPLAVGYALFQVVPEARP